MASKRRLLHVFSTFNVGGPQVRFASIAERFADKYHHLIIAMDGGFACAERLAPSVSFETIPLDLRSRAPLVGVPQFRSTLKKLSPDLLVTYNWGAVEWGLANMFGACAHVHIEDGFGPEEADRQIPRRVWFRRLALRSAVAVALPSRRLYDIATMVWRLNPKKVTFVPNGIDCARFAQPADPDLLQQLGIKGTAPVVGTLGALRPEKNFSRMIKAFASATQSQAGHLVIAGQGGEHDRLNALRKELDVGDKVTLAGYVNDPAKLVAAFDVFALSSDTEQMPVSVLEAMAAGKAVASTDVGDVKAMVSHPNKKFIAGDSQEALTESLSMLLADAVLRDDLGAANQTHVRAVYDEEPMFQAWDQLFSYRRDLHEQASIIGTAPDPI